MFLYANVAFCDFYEPDHDFYDPNKKNEEIFVKMTVLFIKIMVLFIKIMALFVKITLRFVKITKKGCEEKLYHPTTPLWKDWNRLEDKLVMLRRVGINSYARTY